MTNQTNPSMLERHEGVWEGYYRYFDEKGNKIDEHKSRLLCRIPEQGKYHQTNFYYWADGKKEIRDFPTRLEGDKIIFYSEIDGWAAPVELDEFKRTMMLRWTRKDDDDLYLYEMIQMSDCGKYRNRVWQWFKNGKLVQRTLIDEQLISRQWHKYDDVESTYDDIANFDDVENKAA